MKLTTTLNLLHEAHACEPRYKVLLQGLGLNYPKDKPINLLTILDICGLDDALWALRATAENCEKVARLMAAGFAETVLPIWEKYSNDKWPSRAIKAARDFANGKITREEMDAARDAALSARATAWYAARDAARDAAADSAGSTAWDAARSAAWDSAGATAWYAAWSTAGDAAWSAARAAAWDAARDAARDKQREIFVWYLSE
jgi:hypothetical protein